MVVDEPALGVPTPLRCSPKSRRTPPEVLQCPSRTASGLSKLIHYHLGFVWNRVPPGTPKSARSSSSSHEIAVLGGIPPSSDTPIWIFCQAVDLGIPPCWKCLPLTSPDQMYLILYTVDHGLPLLQLWRCEVPYNMERIFYYLTGGSSLIVSGKDGGSVQNLGCAIGIGTNFVSFRAILKSVCWWLMVWVVM